MNYIKGAGIGLLSGIILYCLGPKADKLNINTSPIEQTLSPTQLELKISREETLTKNLKPDNEARIIWADNTSKQKTPYSIVYLHGFSASQAEGDPIHQHLAKRYGCNLFLSRLSAHGLQEEEPLIDLRAEQLIESAKEAIAIGKQLGEKVILMSTSTGGTLSLLLAGKDTSISGLILYSPNIDLYDDRSFLLTGPWGLQIARAVIGDRYYTFKASEAAQQYWNTKYRIEALIELKRIIDAGMNEKSFNQIHQPVFLGYYYKNETEQDDVVSVSRMLEMFDELGTPSTLKRKVCFPEAGHHCIGSSYWVKDTRPVEQATSIFLEEVMHLSPLNP